MAAILRYQTESGHASSTQDDTPALNGRVRAIDRLRQSLKCTMITALRLPVENTEENTAC